MKKDKKICEDSYWLGYYRCKKDIVNKLLRFVDKESKFIPDIHSDKLLDRFVEFIKKI